MHASILPNCKDGEFDHGQDSEASELRSLLCAPVRCTSSKKIEESRRVDYYHNKLNNYYGSIGRRKFYDEKGPVSSRLRSMLYRPVRSVDSFSKMITESNGMDDSPREQNDYEFKEYGEFDHGIGSASSQLRSMLCRPIRRANSNKITKENLGMDYTSNELNNYRLTESRGGYHGKYASCSQLRSLLCKPVRRDRCANNNKLIQVENGRNSSHNELNTYVSPKLDTILIKEEHEETKDSKDIQFSQLKSLLCKRISKAGRSPDKSRLHRETDNGEILDNNRFPEEIDIYIKDEMKIETHEVPSFEESLVSMTSIEAVSYVPVSLGNTSTFSATVVDYGSTDAECDINAIQKWKIATELPENNGDPLRLPVRAEEYVSTDAEDDIDPLEVLQTSEVSANNTNPLGLSIDFSTVTSTTHWGNKNECRLLCEPCSLTSSSRGRLKQPIFGDASVTCNCCRYNTKWLGNLKEHAVTNDSEHPFACELCPSKATYIAHLREPAASDERFL